MRRFTISADKVRSVLARYALAGVATAIALACITWSIGSVLSQRNLPLAPGAMGFASEMICGGVVLLVIPKKK